MTFLFHKGKPYKWLNMIIDAHIHIGKWREKSFCGRQSSFDDCVRILKKCGIDGALVMTGDEGDNEKLLQSIKSHNPPPEIFFAFWINPKKKKNFLLLNKNKNLVKALKIHPSFLRKPITDDGFKIYLKWAEEQNKPCIVHCGRWKEVASYKLVLKIAKIYPCVNFILSHMGGDSPVIIRGAISDVQKKNLKNIYFGTESIREFWLIEEAIKKLGADRLIFGSDYNLNHPATFIAMIENLSCKEEEKEMILSKNFLKLMEG